MSKGNSKSGRNASCFIMAFVLWMLLYWSLDWSVILVGAAFALLVTVTVGPRFPLGIAKAFNPMRWFYAAVYIPYFLFYFIVAGVDSAIRSIHPDIPVRPGIVKVRTNLKSEFARAFLANSITLAPGTLAIDIDGQDMYIHWMSIHTDDQNGRFNEIVGRFESLLRRIFE